MTILEKDTAYIWHPYTQMGLQQAPVSIISGKGVYLYDDKGNAFLDAISSWWVNLHGHAHPYIANKVAEQLNKLEHVLFAGFTHEPAVNLAERLLNHLPKNQTKVFYSDNGSTAVEVALKMAIQYWFNIEKPRTKIIAFENAYHGDTFGAMSVSGRGLFTKPYNNLLFDVVFLPYPSKGNEEQSINAFTNYLNEFGNDTAAFIFEPLVQGTAGMQMCEPKALDSLLQLCSTYNIITIADEVMTGFGRTGKTFASNYLINTPHIFCLSKGITGGTMALGVTTASQQLFDSFYSTNKLKTFFHGHSYTANPVACSAALASLDLLELPETTENIARISFQNKVFCEKLIAKKGVKRCTSLGTILVIEIEAGENINYVSEIRDKLYNYFIENKIIIRPLGNIIYAMPPYCITNSELQIIYNAMEIAIEKFAL